MATISPDASLIVSSPKGRPTPNLLNASFVKKSGVQPAGSPQRDRNAPHFKEALERMLPEDCVLGQAKNTKVHLVKRDNEVVCVLKIAEAPEKTIMELLNPHPHCIPCRITRLTEETASQKHWVIQMPYYPRTLKEEWMLGPDHKVDEDHVWTYLLDMTLALHHLSQHGVVHKDFKDDNILCGPRLLPSGARDPVEPTACVLADFGVASAQVTSSGAARFGADGDGIIMAPEAIHAPSHKSDMFSLGLTMAGLRSGFLLPRGGSEAYNSIRRGSLPSTFLDPHATSPDLRRVLEWLVSVNPDHRPSARELLRTEPLRSRLVRRTWRHITSTPLPFLVPNIFLFALLLLAAAVHMLLGLSPDVITTACIWWLTAAAERIPSSLNSCTLITPSESENQDNDDSVVSSPASTGKRRFSGPYDSDDDSSSDTDPRDLVKQRLHWDDYDDHSGSGSDGDGNDGDDDGNDDGGSRRGDGAGAGAGGNLSLSGRLGERSVLGRRSEGLPRLSPTLASTPRLDVLNIPRRRSSGDGSGSGSGSGGNSVGHIRSSSGGGAGNSSAAHFGSELVVTSPQLWSRSAQHRDRSDHSVDDRRAAYGSSGSSGSHRGGFSGLNLKSNVRPDAMRRQEHLHDGGGDGSEREEDEDGGHSFGDDGRGGTAAALLLMRSPPRGHTGPASTARRRRPE
ncbi:WEE protein kinase [Salpingoeca rosetta]|uniref:WEE protein kinase n=1 Tax=Salpingoeca rosetta (strain ATCC 50818 / BSB-021) TaxID=946362 RepID=F2U4I8_SALR5|nr:WEE protein kinase [Salpingoeca rosetta]EGD82554.1 WEE protein kinase [Salpingoeca rosetta]|eukprot:XP_004995790.1 WEE protein kinase [Salpingoeca rosetta]